MRANRHQAGVMLIEALIGILIFSIGILALLGMQGAAMRNTTDAKYRSEAACSRRRSSGRCGSTSSGLDELRTPGGPAVYPARDNWVTAVAGSCGRPGRRNRAADAGRPGSGARRPTARCACRCRWHQPGEPDGARCVILNRIHERGRHMSALPAMEAESRHKRRRAHRRDADRPDRHRHHHAPLRHQRPVQALDDRQGQGTGERRGRAVHTRARNPRGGQGFNQPAALGCSCARANCSPVQYYYTDAKSSFPPAGAAAGALPPRVLAPVVITDNPVGPDSDHRALWRAQRAHAPGRAERCRRAR